MKLDEENLVMVFLKDPELQYLFVENGYVVVWLQNPNILIKLLVSVIWFICTNNNNTSTVKTNSLLTSTIRLLVAEKRSNLRFCRKTEHNNPPSVHNRSYEDNSNLLNTKLKTNKK